MTVPQRMKILLVNHQHHLGNDQLMIDGAELVADSVSDPANGSVVVNADGTVTYTPDQDFSGTDTFTYTIRDEDGETSTATVTVTVDDDGVPVAVDDSATTDEETAVTIDVKANDAWNDNATLTSTTDPANGSISVGADGQITYTPDADFEGTDSIYLYIDRR